MSDDEDVEMSIFQVMQGLMKSMLSEVDESLESLRHIYHDVHHSQDLFTHLHLQEKLQPLCTRWVKEKRMSETGFLITLTKEEQEEFGIETSHTNVYTICEKLVYKSLFSSKPKIESQ